MKLTCSPSVIFTAGAAVAEFNENLCLVDGVVVAPSTSYFSVLHTVVSGAGPDLSGALS